MSQIPEKCCHFDKNTTGVWYAEFCNDLGGEKGGGNKTYAHYHHQAHCFNWHDYILIGMKKI